MSKRTDLAVEAKEIWQEDTRTTGQLRGVKASESDENGFHTETVRILDERGEQALGKPRGTYITIDLDSVIRKEEDSFSRGIEAIKKKLSEVYELKASDSIFVAGLGNPAITPDDLGPQTVDSILITRHLVDSVPEHFGEFRRVSAIKTGVLGTTGIESGETVQAICDRVKPDVIVVVDALASRNLSRVCRTVQITDSGIVPGSGVGNSRAALSRETLGVPVVSIGVPTVVDAETLVADILEKNGIKNELPEHLLGGGIIVTPKEIDSSIHDISKLLAYGLNLWLHHGLTLEDIDMFLS